MTLQIGTFLAVITGVFVLLMIDSIKNNNEIRKEKEGEKNQP